VRILVCITTLYGFFVQQRPLVRHDLEWLYRVSAVLVGVSEALFLGACVIQKA